MNRSIYERLHPTDQAALILHEAIYKVERDTMRARNSDPTRFVGYVFSDAPLTYSVLGEVFGEFPVSFNLGE